MKKSLMDRFTNVCEATVSQSHDLDMHRPSHRKGKKLLAEKKRRARINNCLMQIRDIVCEGKEEKESDLDKMEKAEILEKTLEVLTRLRADCNPTTSRISLSERKVMAVRYASGFSSCAEESIRYIQNSRLVPAEVKIQLQTHLRMIARRMETVVTGGNEELPGYGQQYSVLTPDSIPLTNTNSMDSQLTTTSESRTHIPSPILSSTPTLQPKDDRCREITTPLLNPQQQQLRPLHSMLADVVDRQEPELSHLQDSSIHSQDELLNPLAMNEISAFKKVDSVHSCSTHAHTHVMRSVSQPAYSSYPSPIVDKAPVPMFHPLPSTSQMLEQPVYRYFGYEPCPMIPSIPTQSVHQDTQLHNHSLSVANTASTTKQSNSNALDLCVKREVHQISPETMWRPW